MLPSLRPIPIPHYNACNYVLFDSQSQYVSLRKLARSIALIDVLDPLEFYRKFDGTSSARFKTGSKEDKGDFQWVTIMDSQANTVSAYRLYATPPETHPTELDCKTALLQLTPHRGYLYSCHWWGMEVRFTYTDCEGGFVSAQTFDLRKDPCFCAFNIGLMLNIPADHFLFDTRILQFTQRAVTDSPSKRLRLQEASRDRSSLSEFSSHTPTLFAGSGDRNIQWYTEPGESGGFIKSAWEIHRWAESTDQYETSHILKALGIPNQHNDLKLCRVISHLSSFAPSLCDVPVHQQLVLLSNLVQGLEKTMLGIPGISPLTLTTQYDPSQPDCWGPLQCAPISGSMYNLVRLHICLDLQFFTLCFRT
jgi:hypothetical protein